MVSGANAAPESIRSGELGPSRSVRLFGETDCAIAPFTSAPASPTAGLSKSRDSECVLFVERIVCYRGRPENASSVSLTGIRRKLGGDRVAHLAGRDKAVGVASDVG